jgi:hypothetical protein
LGLSDTLGALLERDDVEWLVRCPEGLLPSDHLFRSGPKTVKSWSEVITQKQLEEAHEKGIDIREFLTPPAESLEPPSFEL